MQEREFVQDTPQSVAYRLTVSTEEATTGVSRRLERHGKRLEVKIPPGTRNHQVIRLRNALRITDDADGDILIDITVADDARRPQAVQPVTDATFEQEVLKASLPVLVDFWAPWCAPCRAIAPITEKLAAEYVGRVKFCKINVDENPLASRRYQISSIPSILYFKDGLIADVSVGAVSAQEIRSRIEALLDRQTRSRPS